MKIKFINRGTSAPITAVITAVDDNYATFDQTTLLPIVSGPTVSYEILQPGGYGYIRLTSEPGDSATMANVYTDFRQAIVSFNASGAQGMILDMRVNTGGADLLSAALSGFFTTDTTLYEQQSYYNPGSGNFELYPLPRPHFNPQTLGTYINPKYPTGTIFTEPQGLYFSKPVIVMVGPRGISSGEGIPMVLQRIPNNKVVSFYGSNGSFGMMEYWSKHYLFSNLSEDLYYRYPAGRSQDKDMRIQLDSDSTMHGGVIPDIRVPINDTVIDQLFIDSVDVELRYSIGQLNSMVGIGKQDAVSPGLMLEQNVPNPATSSTLITYSLKENSFVSLTIFDLHGKFVKTLVDEPQKAGRYSVSWNVEKPNPGVFFYRITTGKESITRKCIFL